VSSSKPKPKRITLPPLIFPTRFWKASFAMLMD
jgi:hypothetical protein